MARYTYQLSSMMSTLPFCVFICNKVKHSGYRVRMRIESDRFCITKIKRVCDQELKQKTLATVNRTEEDERQTDESA